MRFKHFRNANVDVSEICVGGWPIGADGYGEVDDKVSVEAIRKAFELGVNIIDTAPDYGNGHSELVVGEALKGLDRSKIFVSTKGGASACSMKAARTGAPYARDGRYENILYECEQSLRRLGTDYIDFYFIHWPDTDTPFSETMEAMKTLKKQGKIRFVGLSNFNRQQITECSRIVNIDAVQPPYSMIVRRDEELLKWCVNHGIATFTYGSLAGGMLTGSFRKEVEFSNRDPRKRFYFFFQGERFEKIQGLLGVMDEISAETGKPLSQIAINWQTSKDFVSTALCGLRNPQEPIENCGAFEWQLTPEQIAKLDAAADKYIDFDGTRPIFR